MNKRLLILLLTIALLLLAVPLMQAGCACPEPGEVDNVDIEFKCDRLRASWSHGSGTESGIILVNGDTYDFIVLQMFDDPSGSYSHDFDPPLDEGTTIFVDIGVFDEMGELIAETVTNVDCNEDGGTRSGRGKVWPCADGRLTFTLCQPLAVYPVVSEDGVGWSVYSVKEDSGAGQFALYVAAETFEALPDEAPANCTIESSDNGQVVLYLLSSGQYQINIGPDHEGKVFEYIFNDLTSPPAIINTYIGGQPPELLPACI